MSLSYNQRLPDPMTFSPEYMKGTDILRYSSIWNVKVLLIATNRWKLTISLESYGPIIQPGASGSNQTCTFSGNRELHSPM